MDGRRVADLDLPDGHPGQQAQVDRIAERQVEPNAVGIDGKPLRGALERGDGEAPHHEVGLPGVGGGIH
ncbi:MAG: hypothetical protein NZM40_02195 [Sphingomonadaceae bacterium]|nr:hypothetical protein [Sphingomonadaceae bacterium]MDW8415687.1 hypothetical protein [Thermaurantiacus sp.]